MKLILHCKTKNLKITLHQFNDFDDIDETYKD